MPFSLFLGMHGFYILNLHLAISWVSCNKAWTWQGIQRCQEDKETYLSYSFGYLVGYCEGKEYNSFWGWGFFLFDKVRDIWIQNPLFFVQESASFSDRGHTRTSLTFWLLLNFKSCNWVEPAWCLDSSSVFSQK